MSSPPSGIVSGPTIWGKVDFGPTFGQVYRPINTKRFIFTTGVIPVLPFDVILAIYPSSSAPCTLQLPDVRLWMLYPYGGFDLTVKYFGDTDLTVTPFAGQTIDGQPNFIMAGTQGVGAIILSPFVDGLSWYTL